MDPAAVTPAFGAPPAKPTAEATGEEDFSKTFAPVVQLTEVATKTGEEDEDVRFKIRCKLFRFSNERREWKERGTGDVRILEHKTTKKIRLLMRREKTLKICLNHYVNPDVELSENVGSDRSWMWAGIDYADGERDDAVLAIRFRDSENAAKFKDAYDEARKHMAELKAAKKAAKDAAAAPAEGDASAEPEKKEPEAEEEKKDADAPAEAEAQGKSTES